VVSALTLENRRILVTGGASGIGLAGAKIFRALGAEVVLADRDAGMLDTVADGIGAAANVAGDVTSEADCDAMIATVQRVCGGLDALFHSAGVSDNVRSVVETDIDGWQRILDINVRGTFLICRAAGRVMIPQGHGAIVNISSVVGLGGIPRRPAYSPAKAAVAHMTRNLASEWGHHGIRVNAIAPGYILTPMVDRLVKDGAFDTDRIARRTPMARLGEPEEIANVAAFLLSDMASYMTGAVVPVDGGWTAYGGAGDVQSC
jgi:NAD(P)-dependent dehydrogenase (short-subunit alcohol dehydrogenase family)